MLFLSSFSPRALLLLFAAAGAGILGAALVSQYGFGMQPCQLCLWQRWPYALAISVALLGAWKARRPAGWFALLGAAYLASAGLGIYHSGVEWGWFPLLTDCTDTIGETDSLAALRAQIMAATAVPCDARQPFFLGLSMANLNVLTSLFLAGVAIHSMVRFWRHDTSGTS